MGNNTDLIETGQPSISIGHAFMILGILFAITIPVSIIGTASANIIGTHTNITSSKAIQWMNLIGYALPFVLTILWAKQCQNLKITDTKSIKPSILIIGFMLIVTIGIISEWISSLIPMPEFIAEIFKNAITLDLAGYLTVAIAAPICEECLFRGIILSALLRRYSPRKAIIWSAIIFGIAHLNPWQFIAAFLIGCAIGWLFWRTKSIWPGIFMHWLNNSAAFAIGYATGDINTSPTEWFGGPVSNAIILVCCILATFFIYKIAEQKFAQKDCAQKHTD